MLVLKNAEAIWNLRKTSCHQSLKKQKKKKQNSCNVQKIVNNLLKNVFSLHTNVSERTLVMVWQLFKSNGTLAAVVSTKSLHNINSTSVCTRKSLFANTAVVS